MKQLKEHRQGLHRIIVWGSSQTLSLIDDLDWVVKISNPCLDGNAVRRLYWQTFCLSDSANMHGCDLLFVPGGMFLGKFRPFVTMSRNMLPFQMSELLRFGFSAMTIKLIALRMLQTFTFKRADGLIFLSSHARQVILPLLHRAIPRNEVIAHGLNDRFFRTSMAPKIQNQFDKQNRCTLLYVSTVDAYKHQVRLIRAVSRLVKNGKNVRLDLVGAGRSSSLKKMKREMSKLDPRNDWINYVGAIPYESLHKHYAAADICVFASTCENLPNILLEKMASGLPIACSNRPPMPEILLDGGVYFNPESEDSIYGCLNVLIGSYEKRLSLARRSFELSKSYDWSASVEKTINFLKFVHNDWKLET